MGGSHQGQAAVARAEIMEFAGGNRGQWVQIGQGSKLAPSCSAA